ncbi:MAG TPA: hypothetical protein VLD63_01710 [Anaerolineales bacterium]|nr:hypothetical protein [Anaerolineales bacterium]
MVALPFVAYLLGAGLLTLMSRRRARLVWGLAVAFGAAALAATLLVGRSVPAILSISAWKPDDVFLDRILLVLDPVGWPIQLAASSVVLAALLSEPVLRDGPGGVARTLAYAAAGMASIQAGNLLTVGLTWTILDVAGGALPGLLAEEEPVVVRSRWIANTAGILLVLGGVLGLSDGGLDRGLSGAGALPLSGGLVVAGCTLRLAAAWWAPTSSGKEDAGTWQRRLFPLAACLAVLGRVLGGEAGPLVPWVAVLGAIAVLLAGAAWARDPGEPASFAGLAVGLAGVAALSGVAGTAPPGAVWSSVGVLLLIAGALFVVSGPQTAWHRWVFRALALVVAGLPFTPGGIVASALVSGDRGWIGWAAGVLGLAGMAWLAVGMWRRGDGPLLALPDVERLTRNAHIAGILVLLACLPLSYLLRVDSESSLNWIGPVAGVALMGVGLELRRRWRAPGRTRGARAARWLDASTIAALLGGPMRALLAGVGRLADLLEGEAAVLWIYVIVVALALAAGLGG